MDMMEDANQLQHAIEVMHTTQSNRERNEAMSYLERVKDTPQSWQLFSFILKQNANVTVKTFCAQQIRHKLQKNIEELSLEDQRQLQDNLIQGLESLGNEKQERMLTNQLSAAFIDLALQSSGWLETSKLILTRFNNNKQKSINLVKVLIMVPEEIEDDKLKVGLTRREELRNQLRRSGQDVATALELGLSSHLNDVEVMEIVMECLASWISSSAIELSDVWHMQTFTGVFQRLANINEDPHLHRAIGEVFAAGMEPLAYNLQVSKDPKERNHYADVLRNISNFIQGLAQPFRFCLNENKMELLENYTSLFTEFALAMQSDLLQLSGPEKITDTPKVLNLLLACGENYDLEANVRTFDFWLNFLEMINSFEQPESYSIASQLESELMQLIDCIWVLSRADPDENDVIEKSDPLQDYRSLAQHAMVELRRLYGAQKIFSYLNNCIAQDSEQWEAVEAILFYMAALAGSVSKNDAGMLVPVVQACLNIVETANLQMKHSILDLFGEIGDLYTEAPMNQFLEPVLQVIGGSLAHRSLNSVAVRAFTAISVPCASQLTAYLNTFVGALNNQEVAACMSPHSIECYMKGVIVILSRVNQEHVPMLLAELLALLKNPLQKISDELAKRQNGNEPLESLDEDTSMEIRKWLNSIVGVFKRLTSKEQKPIIMADHTAMIQDIWPLISRICHQCLSDDAVVESGTRCIRHFMRKLGAQTAPWVGDLLNQITVMFRMRHHSSCLYLGSIVVDEFGVYEESAEPIMKMTKAFCEPAFEVLSKEDGFTDNPDIVEDFFRLMQRNLERLPQTLVQSDIFDNLMRCAIAGLTLDHYEATPQLLRFFSTYCRVCQKDNMQKALVYCPEITKVLLKAVCLDLREYFDEEAAEVFRGLQSVNHQEFFTWIHQAIENLPPNFVTSEVKQEFFDKMAGAEHTVSMRNSLSKFAHFYRG